MLDKIVNINKWRKDFMFEVFMLFLSIKGRINFFQLERYGQFCELQATVRKTIRFYGIQ
jgi:hypothetical protein